MNLGRILKKYQNGGSLTDSSRGSLVISPEQAITLAKQRGFGQLSQKDQIRIGNNIYANELAKKQRDELALNKKKVDSEVEKIKFADPGYQRNTQPNISIQGNDAVWDDGKSIVGSKQSYNTVEVKDLSGVDELYYRVVNNPEDMKAFLYAAKNNPNGTINQVMSMLKTQGVELPKITQKPKVQKQVTKAQPTNVKQQNFSREGDNTIWDDGKTISAPTLEKLSGTLTEQENPDLNPRTIKLLNRYMVSPNENERRAADFVLGNLNKHDDINAATNWKDKVTDHNVQKAINQIHTEVLDMKEAKINGVYGTRKPNGKSTLNSNDFSQNVIKGIMKENGGLLKNYSFGGDLGKYALNNLEQSTLGMLGLDFYKPKFESDTMGKINDVTQGVGKTVSSLAPMALSMIPGVGTIGGAALGAVQGVGKQISQFQRGGVMNQQGGILPQNPNDLEAVTENTIEYRGNPHTQGGIPLNNGKELEKDETVIKQGALGNKDPYAISPNLVLDRETAKLVGLSSKYAGLKLSDVSRKIEDMKPQKEYDKMSVKTNAMNKKFALNRLIKANEILSAQQRQQNPIPQEMSDLRMEEMQLGGKMPDDFMDYYKTTTDYMVNPDTALTWLGDNPTLWSDYKPDYLEWKKTKPSTVENIPIVKDNTPLQGSTTRFDINNEKGGFQTKSLNPEIKLDYKPSFQWNNSIPTTITTPNGTLETNSLMNDSSKSRGFNLGDVGLDKIGMGLKGASLLANFASIGKKPGEIPAQFNPYATEILNNYRNTIDNQSIKNDITSVLNTGLAANPSRSWNVQRAVNSELTGKAMESMGRANLQNQELNNRYRTELGNVQNNLGTQNVQAKNMAEVINAQTQANWRNNLRSAIGNVGNDVADMALKKDYLNKYTAEHMKILNEKGKDYGIFFTNTEDYLKAVTNPEAALILGKIQNKTATPEEIQKLKDIQVGKAVNYIKG